MKRFLAYILIAAFITACGCPEPAHAAQSAQSIQFLLSQVRNTSGPLAGGKVYAYAAGTSTAKTIWLNRSKATVAANPYTLDANGTAALFGDGVYRIVIKTAAGVTVYDRDHISIKDVANYTTDLADYSGNLTAAIAAIGSTPTTLTYASDVTLSANIVIPSTVELVPLNGSKINHSTYTISYAGSTAQWPTSQVFNGTGLVSGFSESKPEWFETNTTPGTTNMTSAFTKAIAAVKAKFGAVKITATSYYINSTVYFDGVALQGVDGFSSQIHVGGAITALKFTTTRKHIGNFNVLFDDYSASAAPTTAVGIQFGGSTYGTAADQFSNNFVENVYVRYAGRSFSANSAGTTGTIWNNTYINCRSDFQSEYGWYFNAIVGGTTQAWINCMVDGVTLDGSLGWTATSAGWYINNIDDVVWINCQADDLYDGKAIYINLATTASIHNFRSESSQMITNNSTMIYANAAINSSNVKIQTTDVDPGVGNSASVIRLGSNGSGVIGVTEMQALTFTSGSFYKLHSANIQSGRGRVTITDPKMWLAEVKRDDVGERTVFANKAPRYGVTGSDPTVGSFEVGDSFNTTSVANGKPASRVCLTAGTMGTLTGVTVSTTSGSRLVTFNSTALLKEGDFISIAGVTDTKRIDHLYSATQGYIDVEADATVSSAAAAYVAATFATTSQIGYRSGVVAPSAVTPQFIGEEYLDTAAAKWYKSKGLTTADWVALN
jgi:hypothetical protein